jgi:1-deoxy-D-xylulose-5-phosphate reductoisomerase
VSPQTPGGGERLRIAVLGSTGSIGRQTLDVAARFPDRVEIVALAAHSSADLLLEQARAFGVETLALGDPAASATAVSDRGVAIAAGPEAVVALCERDDVDVVLNAMVGAVGLRASARALAAGKRLALANKESLVVGGDLLMPMTSPDQLVPVDSEHSALFQCLIGEPADAVARLWLTASGGPFRGRTRADLGEVTVEQALAHPRWTMGPKITIDSATLANKALETIEAHHLFGVGYDRIRIVVHPQSCIHSMVEFADGSVKAHLGATDMRVPIQYALSHPDRWDAPVPPVDFAALGSLEFEEPDLGTFGCLRLGIEAGRTGGTAPAAFNAADEVAVAAFLERSIGFADIESVIAHVLEAHAPQRVDSLEQLEEVDAEARLLAREAIQAL